MVEYSLADGAVIHRQAKKVDKMSGYNLVI